MPPPSSHPQENYEMYSVELGPGPGGDMAAKMSKKKAGKEGGKKKDKLENMKKEMEIVSVGLGAWAGDRSVAGESWTVSVLPLPTERPPAVSGRVGTEISDQCDQGELGAGWGCVRRRGEREREREKREKCIREKGKGPHRERDGVGEANKKRQRDRDR